MNYQKGKLRKQSHLQLHLKKKKKPLGINLTKEAKELYSENYKTLKKEIEEHTNKWKHILCLWTRKFTSLKCPHYPKQSVDHTTPSKMLMAYFTELEQKNTKKMKLQKILNNHSNLEKEYVEGTTLPDIKLYYRAIVIKTSLD